MLSNIQIYVSFTFSEIEKVYNFTRIEIPILLQYATNSSNLSSEPNATTSHNKRYLKSLSQSTLEATALVRIILSKN